MAARSVDVVVPVYNAATDLRRCVESVFAQTATPYRLVLIDDASPDPAIAALFGELERRAMSHVVLLRNEHNLGFTGTANRGFALSNADVVLLNSDTVVTSGWLDALVRCARTDAAIGTVTPFSNNAEICSFPRFCADNPWPDDADPESVRAALAEAAVPTYPDLPTGVGFCLLVRRALLEKVGNFDPVFGLGYGEENDLCMRAAAAGYRNVLCDDAFVLHFGGRSFEGQKATLGQRNIELLVERHPRYLEIVRDYIARDPLRAIRDAALLRQRVRSGPAEGILHVLRRGDGASEACARGMVERSASRYRHYLAYAEDDTWHVDEPLTGESWRAFAFRRETGEGWPEFLGGLCASFGVDRIVVHDASAWRAMVAAMVAMRGGRSESSDDLECTCSEPAKQPMPVARDAHAPFAPRRMRDALGYIPWQPPALDRGSETIPKSLVPDRGPEIIPEPPVFDRGSETVPEPPVLDRGSESTVEPPAGEAPATPSAPHAPSSGILMQAVLRFGSTLPGRALRRLMPLRMRQALKARLW